MVCSILTLVSLLCLQGLFLEASATPNKFPESPKFPPIGESIYGGLTVGIDREQSIQKLQENGLLGYLELHSDLVKSPVRWDGQAFELTCKFSPKGGLELCLIQGEAGWQDFFYNDIVQAQWQILRNRVDQAYGQPKHRTEFPDYWDVPLNDKGGYVTDRWNLKDRTLLLTVQTYTKEDCCTKQVLDFSCCTLLIEPK